jgi:hypothetical protein
MNDPYGRKHTFTHDWFGGIVLADTTTGWTVYFQPGDDATKVDDYFDRLVGECGYDGQSALAIIWEEYKEVAS